MAVTLRAGAVRRALLALAAAAVVGACSGATPAGPAGSPTSGSQTGGPGSPAPSPSSAPSGGAGGQSILDPKGDGGVVLDPLDNPDLQLEAGTYRIAWWAPQCSKMRIFLTETRAGGFAEEPKEEALPGGERTVDVPSAGTYYLNRAPICSGDYLVRIERMGG